MFALFWKYPKDKSAIDAIPTPAKQNITHASGNMGHTNLSSLEQSCQGTTYYRQPISARENKTRPITSGNLDGF
jgi:hypothetical protein